ncbi:MAG TPA: hypothetical protein VFJ17_02765 [Mycobacteriales bacterium]|nr:hypothetical protein [Mycobacteriales bacterium]
MRTMRSVRSYRFAVDERLVAASASHSRLVGSVVRGQGLTYRLSVGSKTTEVVRLRSATYVRVVPHRWSRLFRPHLLADPTASLFQILNAMVPVALAHSNHILAVNGPLPVTAARAAGLPATKPAEVTVTMDGRGRVIALDVATTTQASGRDVKVSLRAAYSGFGQVPRIRKPV